MSTWGKASKQSNIFNIPQPRKIVPKILRQTRSQRPSLHIMDETGCASPANLARSNWRNARRLRNRAPKQYHTNEKLLPGLFVSVGSANLREGTPGTGRGRRRAWPGHGVRKVLAGQREAHGHHDEEQAHGVSIPRHGAEDRCETPQPHPHSVNPTTSTNARADLSGESHKTRPLPPLVARTGLGGCGGRVAARVPTSSATTPLNSNGEKQRGPDDSSFPPTIMDL